MLSAFPAPFSADSLLGNQFPPFEPGFPPWENHEPSFLFHLQEEPAVPTPNLSHEPVSSNSGSDPPNPTRSSGSDDSNRNEERKRRRMMSNRESARRSRMRKQKHLENLRNQANRLKLGNREQSNRLRLIVYQTQLFRRENDCLRTEAAVLRQRLWDIRQVLVVRQLQQLMNNKPMQINNPHSINHDLIN